jgi:hypothetical protein
MTDYIKMLYFLYHINDINGIVADIKNLFSAVTKNIFFDSSGCKYHFDLSLSIMDKMDKNDRFVNYVDTHEHGAATAFPHRHDIYMVWWPLIRGSICVFHRQAS